jgi:arsenite methyltransferase
VKDTAEVRSALRRRYAALAATTAGCGCCGGDECAEPVTFGPGLYAPEDRDGAPDDALAASLGCGVPTAMVDLQPGETVLDLGSGGGADVLIAARRVAPGGRVIGLDMTAEMLDSAARAAIAAGPEGGHAHFVRGYLEQLPLREGSVDLVISNCVINLTADKPLVLREASRVLRPGGRIGVSDVVADPGTDARGRAGPAEWAACVVGALTADEFHAALAAAELVDIEIVPTHRVHEHASAAIVRARKPRLGERLPDLQQPVVGPRDELADDGVARQLAGDQQAPRGLGVGE